MTEPLISVIVPVYKVEPYLKQCVDSIRNQTYRNLEIILIDDGSPDRCGQMCDTFAAEDPRIRVIHKENGGLSDARNTGLDSMCGDYVGFVDSDDWIEPDMYQTLLDTMLKNNAKISIGGISLDSSSGTRSWNPDYTPNSQPMVFSVTEALRELTRQHIISNSVCDKLFHRDIFANIRMTKGIINEDMEIIHHCLEKSQYIAYNPKPFYHYVMSDDSITRSTFTEKRFTQSDMTRKRAEYFSHAYPQIYPDAVAGHLVVCLNLISASAGIQSCAAKRKALIREVRALTSRHILTLLSKKDKIKLMLCLVSPYLFSKITNAYHVAHE